MPKNEIAQWKRDGLSARWLRKDDSSSDMWRKESGESYRSTGTRHFYRFFERIYLLFENLGYKWKWLKCFFLFSFFFPQGMLSCICSYVAEVNNLDLLRTLWLLSVGTTVKGHVWLQDLKDIHCPFPCLYNLRHLKILSYPRATWICNWFRFIHELS